VEAHTALQERSSSENLPMGVYRPLRTRHRPAFVKTRQWTDPIMKGVTPGRIRAETRRMARWICAHIAPHPRPETGHTVELALSQWIPEAEESILSLRDSDAESTILVEAYADRRRILKRLADGLAWHMFGFDEHWMRQQPAHPPVSYIARKAGSERERLAVESLLQRPDVLFAMQNDLTNVLRFHDVTYLDDEFQVHSIEVKSSSRWDSTPRTTRQRERNRALAEYLRTDESVLPDGQRRRAIPVDVEPSYYWNDLERTVREARIKGASWTHCDDIVAIVANTRGEQVPYESTLRGWQKPSLTFGVLNRHFDGMNDDELVAIRPVTAFEISHDVLYPITVGDVVVMALVNLDNLRKAFVERGLTVAVNSDLQWRVSISEHEEITLLAGLWHRLLYSLMSVPSFVAIVEGAAKANRS
jgi:hypothetical protein